jgi:hypothetical protein
MTERDAFELRLGVAVHSYVGRASSDLDPAELAHRIATSEPRRQGPAATLGWRAVAIPRVAWVLLLLAALLVAMAAGALVVGSQQEKKLPAVVPPVGPTATTSTARTTVGEGTYTAVSADGSHSCAIRMDGTIVCWGANSSGQATPPDGTYVAVSAGGDHTCAIRTDGKLLCWGANSSGQATPPDGTYVAVSAGGRYTCAIRTDGKLICWGDDSSGEATAPSGTYRVVGAGQAITCAIRTDGTMTCWGFDDEGRLSPPTGAYASVDAFGQCAVRIDGALACWGTGGTEPTPPPGTYLAVSGTWSGPCAIRTDGTLTCWGPDAGPLPPAGSYTALSVGLPGYEACAIRTDGKLTCWGSDWIAKTDMRGNWMGPPTTLIPDTRGILPASEIPEIHRGTVEFGPSGSGCSVTTPSTTFSVGDAIRFAANLERLVRADEVVTIALSVNGEVVGGDVLGEAMSRTFDAPGDCVAGFMHWAYAAPPWRDLSAFPISWSTGHYLLELSVEGRVLSRGEFDVGP